MRNTPSPRGNAFLIVSSPIGYLAPVAGGRGLVELMSHPDDAAIRRRLAASYPGAAESEGGVIGSAVNQLAEYFRGARTVFDLPCDLEDLSAFSRQILRCLARVPFGESVSYGELALASGFPKGARAVGRVMAGNPLPIIFPCHRVVGARGQMTGYSGGKGVETKGWLLDFERRVKKIGSPDKRLLTDFKAFC